jgi:molybdate transport system substrate-binding protein
LNQIFAAAVASSAAEPQGARRLIAFLASAGAASAIRAGGMEPLGAQRP